MSQLILRNVYILNIFDTKTKLLCSIDQGYGQDVGNLGVLHVSKGTESQDFCIAYNANWTSIPADLDNTVNTTCQGFCSV